MFRAGARRIGAGDGIQTRGLYLGRVPLYQLSYARILETGFWPVSTGSGSRIRTYNPSVNSRMLYR